MQMQDPYSLPSSRLLKLTKWNTKQQFCSFKIVQFKIIFLLFFLLILFYIETRKNLFLQFAIPYCKLIF